MIPGRFQYLTEVSASNGEHHSEQKSIYSVGKCGCSLFKELF